MTSISYTHWIHQLFVYIQNKTISIHKHGVLQNVFISQTGESTWSTYQLPVCLVGETSPDSRGLLSPILLMAITRNLYFWPVVKSLTFDLVVCPSHIVISVQILLSMVSSNLYPASGDPPLFLGGDHSSVTLVSSILVNLIGPTGISGAA